MTNRYEENVRVVERQGQMQAERQMEVMREGMRDKEKEIGKLQYQI